MEVVFRSQIFFLAFAVLAISGCQSEKVGTRTSGFQDLSASCAADALPNSFVVRWKDGSYSVEKAANKQAFMDEVMTPHEDEIQFAEHDMVFRIPQEPAAKNPQAAFTAKEIVPVDWGQQRINAPAVWEMGFKGDGVIVAVVDSGVDITHLQLRDQIAFNTKETANGIDDDGNGLIDDINGFDFYSHTGKMSDGTGHGTHVSGVILANPNAGPIKGVAPSARLLPLRFMNSKGEGTLGGAIDALNYAVERGARVINASWGGTGCSAALREAIEELEEKGVLFVVAAGNSGNNLDYKGNQEYPAAFTIPGMLTVGASTYHEAIAAFSNFSYSLVHLAAPGQEIYSTYPGSSKGAGFPSDKIMMMGGTSMATPFVSGAAAVLFSVRPRATVQQVKKAIMAGVDLDSNEPLGIYPVITGGRLNLKKAVDELIRQIP